jgi:dTDP-4-amino-4,6-dideoxy-D-galactose acyltransferase
MRAEDSAPCEHLPWDSEFWGGTICRVRGHTLSERLHEQIDDWARAREVCCLYFLARSDDPGTTRLAEDAGFHLVDVRLTLDRPVAEIVIPLPGRAEVVIREARPADVPQLEAIAADSYHDTRFYADRCFPPERCDEFYRTWIKRSCDGYADAVLVADLGGEPVGYISCHLDDAAGIGQIGLVGVSPRAQGDGIGGLLVARALQWFAAHSPGRVLVVTQGRNYAAQRLYQRNQFRTCEVQLWYHKWYSPLRAT